ncbi:hypothetical protein [Terriglobus sp. RCC_193]|uniref:hypothetical protein n=1 Tax=Terriglobus sp. RCC_193 TaxID=3239218 RepID=UPI00352346BC
MIFDAAANPSNFVLTYVTPFASPLVALAVGVVAYQQWKTARDKLRLDLYDRRFAIFKTALDFYMKVVLGDWKNDPETEASSQRFTVALQESQFLFDEKSGIYAFLREFSDKAFHIIQMKKGNLSSDKIGPELYMREFDKFSNGLAWINENLPLLTNKMAPYLNFHRAN